MKRQVLFRLKILRISSQAFFFALFIYVFVRSLDPFTIMQNPFLRFDPLVFLTNPRADLLLLASITGLVALTLMLGRFFCGWVCPMGSLIELVDFMLLPIRRVNPIALKGVSSRSSLVRYPPALVTLGATIVTAFMVPNLLPFFHPNVWIVRIFSLSAPGVVFLGLILAASVFGRRLWCVYICPLGALYGLLSGVSLLRLRIRACTGCGECALCPMKAADSGKREILAHQCILCFDFEHRCRIEGFEYGTVSKSWMRQRGPQLPNMPEFDRSRRNFLIQSVGLVGGAVGGLLLGGASFLPGRRTTGVWGELSPPAPGSQATVLLRPPGVVDETTFLRRCVRCLHCVQSCPNKIIEVTGLEAGFASLFTPSLNFQRNGCDFRCQVCQLVCPNQAIPLQSLAAKQVTPIGRAVIDEKRCVVFADKKTCLVCEELCPTPEKAVVFAKEEKVFRGERTVILKYPSVVKERCNGCGICQANCPADNVAITVTKVSDA